MSIFVDINGGDNAPSSVLEGCVLAREKYGADVKEVESITQGLQALAGNKGSAFVSAGSTGELILKAQRILGRQEGIARGAIAGILPSAKSPFILIDSGACVRCTPQILAQFAQMGSVYAQKVFGISKPRVALLNIGTEEDKGDELRRETNALLKNSSLNYVGNAEAREVPFGVCEVLVTDGFSGNVFLKTYEGTALAMISQLKRIYSANSMTKFSALFVKKGLRDMRRKMDYNQYGGAAILGFNGILIKAHGASKAAAICAAIEQAGKLIGYSRLT